MRCNSRCTWTVAAFQDDADPVQTEQLAVAQAEDQRHDVGG